MTADSRFVFPDILKMTLSAGWIALVAMVTQSVVVHRSGAQSSDEIHQRARTIHAPVTGFRDGSLGPADPRLVLARDGSAVVHLPADGVVLIGDLGFPDAASAAESIDRAVKTYGIERVGLVSSLYDRFGFDITVDLFRRGYGEGELLKLLGGNSARVAATPVQ